MMGAGLAGGELEIEDRVMNRNCCMEGSKDKRNIKGITCQVVVFTVLVVFYIGTALTHCTFFVPSDNIA